MARYLSYHYQVSFGPKRRQSLLELVYAPRQWKALLRKSSFKLRSATQKLGAEAFEEVYDYLKRARQQSASEAEIRESLEKVVPRASDCFEVDQLLYFEEQLLIRTEGPTRQNLAKQLSNPAGFQVGKLL